MENKGQQAIPENDSKGLYREDSGGPKGDAVYVPADVLELALDETSIVKDLVCMLSGNQPDTSHVKPINAITIQAYKGKR